MTATEIQAPAALAPYLTDFERYSRERPGAEPAFVQALRRAGLERFAALGFPTTRQEDWRLTSVAPIVQGTFHRSLGDPNGIAPEQIAPYDFPAAARLVFVDGRFSSRLSAS